MLHSAGKKGDILGFNNILSVANYRKTRRGPFEILKFFQKVAQYRKNFEKGDPLVSSGVAGVLPI